MIDFKASEDMMGFDEEKQSLVLVNSEVTSYPEVLTHKNNTMLINVQE